MISKSKNIPVFFYVILLLNILIINSSYAQNKKLDSLLLALHNSSPDSNKVKTLNSISYEFNLSNPLKGLEYAKLAYNLSKKIKYPKGEIRALDNLADGYNHTGNFNKSMEIYLEALAVDEKAKNLRGMASSLINLGIMHAQQKDYTQALYYYRKSDSIITAHHFTDIEFYFNLDLGDLYENLNKIDTAFTYYLKALELAKKMGDPDLLGITYLNLGSCYDKLQKDTLALSNYFVSMNFLRQANDEMEYGVVLKKIGKLYLRNKQTDSALVYAHRALGIAEKGAFQTLLLETNSLLALIYKNAHKSDSVVYYMEKANIIKDSISSAEKIKAFQVKSINEQIRQNELTELRLKEEENRYQQLQLLLIGIFIPIFFLLTVFLSRKKIHRKAIQILGIVSLLLLFEYLTLLLHPLVVALTHHTPILELLVFVGIAAILIPSHHRIEHWLMEKLTVNHHKAAAKEIAVPSKMIKIKTPSNLPDEDN